MTDSAPGCLLIRADASTRIGTGHVMRCLALAQAWQQSKGQAVFAMTTRTPALEEQLKSEGMEVAHLLVQSGSTEDATQTADLARQKGANWVVVDGYDFGPDYQRIIKESGLCLMFIDDNGHANRYYADILLNQNLHAHESLYVNRESYTQLLLGTRYVLLRQEFLKWRAWRRAIPDVARKVLVTLGGGDPDNVTLKAIRGLQQMKVDGLEVVVVIGANNPHYEELQVASRSSRFPISIIYNAATMAELMAWADVAISAGGSACWEVAFMGLPSIILVVAENQRSIAKAMSEIGATIRGGCASQIKSAQIADTLAKMIYNPVSRRQISVISRTLVDGHGVERAVLRMNCL